MGNNGHIQNPWNGRDRQHGIAGQVLTGGVRLDFGNKKNMIGVITTDKISWWKKSTGGTVLINYLRGTGKPPYNNGAIASHPQ